MRGIVILVLAVAAVAPAAEWVFLETDADSYVYYYYDAHDDEPRYVDDNFGGAAVLAAEYIDYPNITHKGSYIHFDLEGIDSGSRVLEAILTIHVTDMPDPSCEFLVYRSNRAWNEYEITWRNQPWFSELIGSWNEDSGYFNLDADEIEDMVDNPGTNYGIVVWTSENWAILEFSSREGGIPPRLKLLISEADVRGASWGEIKAAFE